jgi:hypothetical protein
MIMGMTFGAVDLEAGGVKDVVRTVLPAPAARARPRKYSVMRDALATQRQLET